MKLILDQIIEGEFNTSRIFSFCSLEEQTKKYEDWCEKEIPYFAIVKHKKWKNGEGYIEDYQYSTIGTEIGDGYGLPHAGVVKTWVYRIEVEEDDPYPCGM